jgi:hypothetical protein
MTIRITSRRIVLLIILVGISVFGFYVYRTRVFPYLVDETQIYQVKWSTRGSVDYNITVLQSWLPRPTRDRVLVFRNNKFVSQERDPVCDLSPTDFCDWPLSSPDQYSIQSLFEQAHRCTAQTKASYTALRPFSFDDFHGFESFEKLYEFAQSSRLLIGSPVLCVVDYDPIYGYPKYIVWYIPNATDGVGTIEITNLTIPPSFEIF